MTDLLNGYYYGSTALSKGQSFPPQITDLEKFQTASANIREAHNQAYNIAKANNFLCSISMRLDGVVPELENKQDDYDAVKDYLSLSIFDLYDKLAWEDQTVDFHAVETYNSYRVRHGNSNLDYGLDTNVLRTSDSTWVNLFADANLDPVSLVTSLDTFSERYDDNLPIIVQSGIADVRNDADPNYSSDWATFLFDQVMTAMVSNERVSDISYRAFCDGFEWNFGYFFGFYDIPVP